MKISLSKIARQAVVLVGPLALALMLTPIGALRADDLSLTSAGPIAFGPEGLLLISDPMAAKIYAVETGDTAGSLDGVKVEVEDVRGKIAAMMGATSDEVRINDLAINPINGRAYLSVSRGSGEAEVSTVLTVDPESAAIAEFDFAGKAFTATAFDNAPESKQTRRGNPRMDSITDMAFIDGQVYVAGLSNEEFASKLRAINFPFKNAGEGTSIEIFHGAHGKFETRAPIRTFAALKVENEVNLLAAYTCTPLVRIPIGELKPDSKVKGTTIAELGNWNKPLDLVVYQKDGKDLALIANSARGVMKVELENIDSQEPIVARTGETAGVPYETIKELVGVMQLDGLGESHGVILVRDEKTGKEHLKTIVLP